MKQALIRCAGLGNINYVVRCLLLSSVFFFIPGCGSSTMTTHAVNDVAQVSEHTACEAMPQASCTGGFGFNIDSQGNFIAGPSLTGKVVQGQITASELASLKSSISAILEAGGGMSCTSVATIPGVGDTISLTFTDNTQSTAFTFQPGQECFLGNMTTGQSFTSLFHQLLTKYYPVPFPS